MLQWLPSPIPDSLMVVFIRWDNYSIIIYGLLVKISSNGRSKM